LPEDPEHRAILQAPEGRVRGQVHQVTVVHDQAHPVIPA